MTFAPSQRTAGPTSTVLQGTAYGAPLGIVVVWSMNTYLLPQPMPAEIGVAVGSLVNAAAVWVAQWLPRRHSR